MIFYQRFFSSSSRLTVEAALASELTGILLEDTLSTENLSGWPILLTSPNSSQISISVLRDDHAAGVGETVPPLDWVLKWVLRWVRVRKKTEATAKRRRRRFEISDLRFEMGKGRVRRNTENAGSRYVEAYGPGFRGHYVGGRGGPGPPTKAKSEKPDPLTLMRVRDDSVRKQRVRDDSVRRTGRRNRMRGRRTPPFP